MKDNLNFGGLCRELKWAATPMDLIFGPLSELPALGEVYAAEDVK